jgi:hypothetical protein
MVVRPRTNTGLDEPAGFDVEREPVAFGGVVVPAAEKGEVLLFVDEEDVGEAFVGDDVSAVSLCAWVSARVGREEGGQTSTSRVI